MTKIPMTFLVCLLGILGISAIAAGSKSASPDFPYDRLELLYKLLNTVYPDLADRATTLDIKATASESRGVIIQNLTIYPCRSATGVSTPTIMVPESGIPPPAAPAGPPRCGEPPTPEFEHFVDISAYFTAVGKQRPISSFTASGSYVNGKLQDLRDQFAGKPYPSDDEALQALSLANPKFGPDHKKGFLAAVPFAKIRELTGCALNPASAKFIAELEENPSHLPPDLQWHVSGTAPAVDRLVATTCWASFEPFDGHLTMFMD